MPPGERLLRDLLIVQLALSGVDNHSIRKIAKVDMNKVTRKASPEPEALVLSTEFVEHFLRYPSRLLGRVAHPLFVLQNVLL